jgi:hypothetical protein
VHVYRETFLASAYSFSLILPFVKSLPVLESLHPYQLFSLYHPFLSPPLSSLSIAGCGVKRCSILTRTSCSLSTPFRRPVLQSRSTVKYYDRKRTFPTDVVVIRENPLKNFFILSAVFIIESFLIFPGESLLLHFNLSFEHFQIIISKPVFNAYSIII